MSPQVTFVFSHRSAALTLFPAAVRKLQLCDELDRSSCGNVLFNGYLPPPGTPPILTWVWHKTRPLRKIQKVKVQLEKV